MCDCQCAVGIVNIIVLKQNRLSFIIMQDQLSAVDINLGVARASEGVSLPPCAQVSLLVVLVGPHLVPPVLHVLTRCPDSSGLPHLLALKLIRSSTGDCDSKTPYVQWVQRKWQ